MFHSSESLSSESSKEVQSSPILRKVGQIFNGINPLTLSAPALLSSAPVQQRSAPSSPTRHTMHSSQEEEGEGFKSFLSKVRDIVAETLQTAADSLRVSPSRRSSIGPVHHYFLVGDMLEKPFKLTYGTNIIGRKHATMGSVLRKDKRVSSHHVELVLTEDHRILAKVIVEDAANTSSLQRMGEQMLTMEADQQYILGEGDTLFLLGQSYPLTVIASAQRSFTPAAKIPIEHWIEETLSLQNNLRGRRRSIGARIHQENILRYRLLQYKLKRKQPPKEDLRNSLRNSSDDSDCLFKALADEVFEGNSEEIKLHTIQMRKDVVQWLRQNKSYTLQNGTAFGSLLENWNEYCDQLEQGIMWGDGIVLFAIAELYGVEIYVITSNTGQFVAEILPKEEAQKVVMLAHFGDLYFESLDHIVDEPQLKDLNPEFSINPRDLKIGDIIGKGSSGNVYLASWNGFKVVAKHVTRSMLSDKKRDAFMREVNILKQLRFPNIILWMGTATYEEDLYIITEYMERGSLKDFLKTNPPLSWRMILRMSVDIAQGMNYLHTRQPKIIHMDLKTANILVDKDYNLKVCDFSVSKFLAKPRNSGNFYGTVAWVAPEIVAQSVYNEKADVYSFAMVLWSLTTNKEPHEDKNEFQIIADALNPNESVRLPIPSFCLPEFADLITRCWARNPELRPSFTEILKSLRRMKKSLSRYQFTPMIDDITRKEQAREEYIKGNQLDDPSQGSLIYTETLRKSWEEFKEVQSVNNDTEDESESNQISPPQIVITKTISQKDLPILQPEHFQAISNESESTVESVSPSSSTTSTPAVSPTVERRGNASWDEPKGWNPNQRRFSLPVLSAEQVPIPVHVPPPSTSVGYRRFSLASSDPVPVNTPKDSPRSPRERLAAFSKFQRSGLDNFNINLSLLEEAPPGRQSPVQDSKGNSSDEETKNKSPRSPREGRLVSLQKNRRNSILINSPRTPPSPRTNVQSPIQSNLSSAVDLTRDGQMWAINFDELEYNPEEDQVGEGTSAKVYKGKYRGQDVAIKILDTQPDQQEFEKELSVLASLRTPHIVYFYGACVSPYYCLVAEFMSLGSLTDVMGRTDFKMNWKRTIKFALQIVKGLNCLHMWKPCIVHRDLKSQNLLVDSNYCVKICDLGLARFTTFENQDTLFKARGSLAYMAPEVWTANSENTNTKSLGFTTKSDVYSFGIVLYEIVHRCFLHRWRIPYPKMNPFAIIVQVSKGSIRPKVHPDIPSAFAELMNSCWDQNPDNRPSCTEILHKLQVIKIDYDQNKASWERVKRPENTLDEWSEAPEQEDQ